MKFAALFLSLLLPITALAGEASLSWVNPIQRTDGTALPASELRGTRIERGTCNGAAFGTVQGESLVAAPGTTLLWQGLPPQVHCFRAYARASSLNAPFLESAPTNPVIKAIDFAPPNPPTNPVVLATDVFGILMQVDRFVLAPVGTVPAGTNCIASQSINGRNAVPRHLVQWHPQVTARPSVVVAQCG